MITEEIPRFGSLLTCPHTHPTMARSPLPRPPRNCPFSDLPWGFSPAPPMLGVHSVLCWRELGMSHITPAAP